MNITKVVGIKGHILTGVRVVNISVNISVFSGQVSWTWDKLWLGEHWSSYLSSAKERCSLVPKEQIENARDPVQFQWTLASLCIVYVYAVQHLWVLLNPRQSVCDTPPYFFSVLGLTNATITRDGLAFTMIQDQFTAFTCILLSCLNHYCIARNYHQSCRDQRSHINCRAGVMNILVVRFLEHEIDYVSITQS